MQLKKEKNAVNSGHYFLPATAKDSARISLGPTFLYPEKFGRMDDDGDSDPGEGASYEEDGVRLMFKGLITPTICFRSLN